MKKYLAMAAFLLTLTVVGCSHPQPPPPPPPPPPAEFREIARQGFHDGYEAARADVNSGRPPGFEKHPRFQNPPVPPEGVEDYRRGFRRGYETFLHPGGPPPGE